MTPGWWCGEGIAKRIISYEKRSGTVTQLWLHTINRDKMADIGYHGHDYRHIKEMSMRTVKASEFKAKCLKIKKNLDVLFT